MTRRLGKPANDNAPSDWRRLVINIPQELPLLEAEFSLVEAHFSTIIEALTRSAANDNAEDLMGKKKP